MKRLIRANAELTHISGPVNHGPARYFVKGDEDKATGRIWAYITKIAPYDDAEYVWAKISGNGYTEFIRDGKKIDGMQFHSYEEDEYETVEEYFDDVIDSIIVELIRFNRDIEPRMMYN